MNQKDRLAALETVEELIGTYKAHAGALRATAGSYFDNSEQRQLHESAARSSDAVAEKLQLVRAVVADSLKRRRSPRKRSRVPRP